jgi:hypothetical protein
VNVVREGKNGESNYRAIFISKKVSHMQINVNSVM